MREAEFIDNLDKRNLLSGIVQPIYWWVDCKGNVRVDYEEMMREFEWKLQEIGEIENG